MSYEHYHPGRNPRSNKTFTQRVAQEIALHLFETGCLTIGYASRLAEMPVPTFRQLLKQRKIPLYFYDVEDFELDLKNLRASG